MSDPSDWAGELLAEPGRYVHDFDLPSQELFKGYGD